MEKKSKPVAPSGEWEKSKLIKIITFFTCVVLIFANLFIFSFVPWGFGYKYYENNMVQIGVTQQENFKSETISNYLAELGENGYYICSTEANKDIVYKQAIIKRSEINDEQLQQIIKDSLNVYVFGFKLSIENDDIIYYFKSEDECNKFINDLKEYKDNIVTTIEDEIIEVHQVTNDKVLQNKIEVYRLDREKRDKEAAEAAEKQRLAEMQAQKVSSRSGGVRTYSSEGSQHPLDSYTYISSNFG
jgi:flavin-dependent dehydrogenase